MTAFFRVKLIAAGLLIVCFVGAGTGIGQGAPAQGLVGTRLADQSEEPPPQPTTNDPLEADMGRSPVLLPVSRVITFTNPGPRAITVRVVTKSCPCLDTELPKGSIEPGARFEVRLRTPVAPTAETQRHWAKLEWARADGRGLRAYTTVGIAYSADLQLFLIPKRLYIATEIGELASRLIVARSSHFAAVNILSASTDVPGFSVEMLARFNPGNPDRPDEEVQLMRVVGAPRQRGVTSGSVVVSTNVAGAEKTVIPFQVRGLDPLVGTPAGFGVVCDRDTGVVVKRLAVRSRIGAAAPELTAKILDEQGRPWAPRGVTLSALPAGPLGESRLELTLDTAVVEAEGVGIVEVTSGGKLTSHFPLAWVVRRPN